MPQPCSPWRRPLLLVTLLLAACGQPSAPPAAPAASNSTPAAQATPAAATTAAASPTAAASGTAAPSAPAGGESRTADGHYALGSADAPVTLIDYSDFL